MAINNREITMNLKNKVQHF